jgi:hypothetical protein
MAFPFERVFLVSFFVYAGLNLIENLVHYNIGRMQDRHTFQLRFHVPSGHDWAKILGVMLMFAATQATVTALLLRW